MIGNGVTSIGAGAFFYCTSLTSITIPNGVTSIGEGALLGCIKLKRVDCEGDAPSVGSNVFGSSDNATVYHLPGTIGWQATFAGRPTAFWSLPDPVILGNRSMAVQNNRFGFTISWATGLPVVVDACTDLGKPAWTPVGTNTLAGGSAYFSDPDWAAHPARFYRLRSP